MKPKTKTLPCALCGRLLDQRADKNNKPYFICEPCGTQFFIRGAAGRERLVVLLESAELPDTKNAKSHGLSVSEQKALSDDLEKLQGYIETFCEDDIIIPNEPFTTDNTVPFSEWSGEVCTRINRAINPFVKS
ncbi:MAG: hypothetical protein JSS95_07595 [Acidobacteria bacterium]|nr:hypothetical protein [Acidobacteriota bacterium]